MRVAIALPASNKAPERRLGRMLSRALPLEGCEVELCDCDSDAAAEARSLAALIQKAGSFDLVHSLLGARTLLWARSIEAPVLLTLPSPASALSLPPAPRVWLVVDGTGDRPAGAEILRTIETPARETSATRAQLARSYREAYAAALDADRRRRLDSGHDRRPWGEYWVLEDAPGHKVKRIEVLPGQRLSYQKHARRSEHWLVLRGRALIVLDGRETRLGPGQAVDIPAGCAHRIGNAGDEPLTFIEVQTGSYFGEDDIVRLQDDYQR